MKRYDTDIDIEKSGREHDSGYFASECSKNLVERAKLGTTGRLQLTETMFLRSSYDRITPGVGSCPGRASGWRIRTVR
ncbi:hypothetical protein EVAR_86847_1 [Eumeta japonica]|uniref:Uncharacterized protein n=1 Tax=Eumeta variegata TaxID=151549 RepID=A0A4C1VVJ8_EUMVA|nr:hypothetical protein EVAR_86847_1 [Eumeta japonica]